MNQYNGSIIKILSNTLYYKNQFYNTRVYEACYLLSKGFNVCSVQADNVGVFLESSAVDGKLRSSAVKGRLLMDSVAVSLTDWLSLSLASSLLSIFLAVAATAAATCKHHVYYYEWYFNCSLNHNKKIYGPNG